MRHLLAIVTVALPLTSSCYFVGGLGGSTILPQENTPSYATGPLGVHREDSISFSDGDWTVIDWEGKRIHLGKGDLRKSLDVRKAKQAPDFDWLYESPEGQFSVECTHN